MDHELDRLRSPSGVFVATEDGSFMPPRHPRYLLRIGRRRPLVRGDELMVGEVEVLRDAGQLDALLGEGVLTETRPGTSAPEADVIAEGMADPDWEPHDEDDSGAPAQVARAGRRWPAHGQAAPPGYRYGHDGVSRAVRRNRP